MRGELANATNQYRNVIKLKPGHADALHHLGIVNLQSGNIQEAISWIRQSLDANRRQPNALSNLGYCLNLISQHQEALNACNLAIRLDAKNDGAWTNLGNAQKELKFTEDAERSYQKALELQPKNPRYVYNLANVLYDQNKHDEARIFFEKSIALDSRIPEAHNNLSGCLLELKSFDLAFNHATLAIELKPDYAEAWNNRGVALNDLKHHEEALSSYERSIELKPDYAEAWSNRGNTLSDLKRYKEALANYEQAFKLKPDMDFLFGSLIHVQIKICNWNELSSRLTSLQNGIEIRRKYSNPFPVLGLFDSPKLQQSAAEIYAKEKYRPVNKLGPIKRRSKSGQIRVGYFSSDFREHPVSYLIADLFELHDRGRFETYAFSFGVNTQDQMRKRLEKSFDKFLDVHRLGEVEIARLSRELKIDIAIDLGGYTKDARPQIFSERAAPIQINYLGYPGTWGDSCMDYFIGDQETITENNRKYFAEKIVYMPHQFQVNPISRAMANQKRNRSDYGLPEHAFVFCCFNNNWKISPASFELWMNILRKVPESVLWLYAENPFVYSNVADNARKFGVTEDRIIFTKKLSREAYMAQYLYADLFLDTLPYNAGTTASDALWTGLPVLTLAGQSFAGRMATSLLKNVGLPELITHTPEQYEALAIELATNPERLIMLKDRLAVNRSTAPLFDTASFTRHLESAYELMYEHYHSDLPPDHIYINP